MFDSDCNYVDLPAVQHVLEFDGDPERSVFVPENYDTDD